MVFGLSSSKSRQRATHQRSSAIGQEFSTKNPNLEARKPRMLRFMLDVEIGHAVPLRAAFVGHRRARSARPTYSQPVSLALLRMRRSLIQNGDGTLIRKIVIIPSAMISLPSMAP